MCNVAFYSADISTHWSEEAALWILPAPLAPPKHVVLASLLQSFYEYVCMGA